MMPYDYIKRAYRTEFKHGMRVLFTEYGNMPGVVRQVCGDPQYVNVKFANGKKGNCHPSSLIIVGNPSGDVGTQSHCVERYLMPKQEGK